jgi:hypothetical protein
VIALATATVKKTNRKKVVNYTEAQKAEYKERMLSEQKQLLESALKELTSQAGWENFIKFGRSNLKRLTMNNALMIWSQNRNATTVWGRKQWEKKGVTINPGAKGVRYFAPAGFFVYKDKDGNPQLDNNGNERKGMYFRIVTGFDISETDAQPDVDVDPMVELTGDELFDLHAPIEQMARELGYSVVYEDMTSGHGMVDDRVWKITVNRNMSGNMIVHTLLHELFHVEGNVNYKDYPRDEAEVIVESATVMALGMLGFDVSGASVPYIASWAKGDIKMVEKHMKLVDDLVKKVLKKLEG